MLSTPGTVAAGVPDRPVLVPAGWRFTDAGIGAVIQSQETPVEYTIARNKAPAAGRCEGGDRLWQGGIHVAR